MISAMPQPPCRRHHEYSEYVAARCLDLVQKEQFLELFRNVRPVRLTFARAKDGNSDIQSRHQSKTCNLFATLQKQADRKSVQASQRNIRITVLDQSACPHGDCELLQIPLPCSHTAIAGDIANADKLETRLPQEHDEDVVEEVGLVVSLGRLVMV